MAATWLRLSAKVVMPIPGGFIMQAFGRGLIHFDGFQSQANTQRDFIVLPYSDWGSLTFRVSVLTCDIPIGHILRW